MRMPWLKSKGVQLDLAGLDPEPNGLPSFADATSIPCDPSSTSVANGAPILDVDDPPGRAALVAIHLLDEDGCNPRTEFPDTELEELTEDIREHGILQPIVVHAADGNGRHLIHFGAKRLRAAAASRTDARSGRHSRSTGRSLRAGRREPEAPRPHAFGPGALHQEPQRSGRLQRDDRQAARHEPDDRGASPGAARSAAGARSGVEGRAAALRRERCTSSASCIAKSPSG